MSALELQVYELFKAKFGEKEAEKFIEYIDFKTEKTAKEKTESLERIVNLLVDLWQLKKSSRK